MNVNPFVVELLDEQGYGIYFGVPSKYVLVRKVIDFFFSFNFFHMGT